jgi:hypothetical protein
VLDMMIRAASPNCAVAGTSAWKTGSAAESPSVSTKNAASSSSSVATAQPRAPRDVHGNAENVIPVANAISSSLALSISGASNGERSTIDSAARTMSRAWRMFVATATTCPRSPGRNRAFNSGRSRHE